MIKTEQSFVEMFAIFELSPDFVCFADKEGYFLKVNAAVQHALGYTKQELYSRPISSFIHPDDSETTKITRSALLEGETLKNFQNRYVTKDGNIVWLEWTSIYLPEKEAVLGIAKNITVRKLMELEVEEKYHRFKKLVSNFKQNIEKDRKFIAYELHEELAQLTAALKMELETIPVISPEISEPIKKQIQQSALTAGMLLKTIQRISYSVSPALLDEFGLDAAIEWLCNEFYTLHKIPCKFNAEYRESTLTNEMQIDFFRICQKALSNVANHAKASKVYITIAEKHHKVKLCITDDGVGFDTAAILIDGGITRMHERVASLNGKMVIESEPGMGTRICVTVKYR